MKTTTKKTPINQIDIKTTTRPDVVTLSLTALWRGMPKDHLKAMFGYIKTHLKKEKKKREEKKKSSEKQKRGLS